MQKKQVYSYMYYLLLARPDLHVVQGMLASEKEVKFLFGIGGFGIRAFTFIWETKDLHRLMYAFIYRLYDPGHFADSSYLEKVPNLEDSKAIYTVRVTEVNGGMRTESRRHQQRLPSPLIESIHATDMFSITLHQEQGSILVYKTNQPYPEMREHTAHPARGPDADVHIRGHDAPWNHIRATSRPPLIHEEPNCLGIKPC
jgi:hypothetical protein